MKGAKSRQKKAKRQEALRRLAEEEEAAVKEEQREKAKEHKRHTEKEALSEAERQRQSEMKSLELERRLATMSPEKREAFYLLKSMEQSKKNTAEVLSLGVWGALKSFTIPLVAWVFCFLPILLIFDYYVPEAYMDEVFHIPQAQAYCDGKWTEYDPKITTGPGLYAYSVGIAKVLAILTNSELSSDSKLCSPFFLRSTVFFVYCATTSVLHALLIALQPEAPPGRRAAKTMEISLFPLHIFFSFFYYTDVVATCLILLTYLLSLHNKHKMASLIGLAACTVRQTSIIWVAWVMVTSLLRDYEYGNLQMGKELDHPVLLHPVRFNGWTIHALLHFKDSVRFHWRFVLRKYGPYFSVLYLFLCFVWIHGSVALGDREHHKARFHAPQLLYFFGFTALFGGLSTFNPKLLLEFIKGIFSFKNLFFNAQCAFLAAQCVQYGTYAHPFILADKILPLYLYGGWVIQRMLGSKLSTLWQLNFFFFTALAVIPAPLIEFRYFITPFILFQLHETGSDQLSIFVNVLGATLVNVVTVYLFLLKPFWWHDRSIARFLW